MDINKIIIIGLSHEELSLEEREILVRKRPEKLIEDLLLENKILGYVNLSTCLRVEFYLELNEELADEDLKNILHFDTGAYVKRGQAAIEYLFKLSCGYFSVIKGEDQILAQVKTSYQKALHDKKTSKLLNIIFNKAIELGKKFRTESKISYNALSLEAISLKIIKETFDNNLEDKNIFILGIGDLSIAIIKILLKEKTKNIFITNRTYHTAEKIKKDYGLEIVDYREKYSGLAKADIIISATSAPHIVVEYNKFKETMDENKKYFFLDLALPRDVDEHLKAEKNISILNLDDVWDIYHKNSSSREQLLTAYYYLIEEQILKLNKSLAYYKI